jgi:uncharacterized repeat protein (TIGR03803 family)
MKKVPRLRVAASVLFLLLCAATALTAQTFKTLASFDKTDGWLPYSGSLTQGSDGDFYGTTFQGGGGGNYGNIFKISTEGVLTTFYNFCTQTNCTDGAFPMAGLVQDTDGTFYGATSNYGTYENGTVFKITSGGALTTLDAFDETNGANPEAALVQGTDGSFYGTTFDGGDYGDGTVFKITPGGTLTTLYSFCAQASCADGQFPRAGLVQATDGNLYGTTLEGGADTDGTLFKITPAGNLTTLHNFCSQSPGCADGANPEAALVQGTDGNLYGTTGIGGTSNGGTIFKVTLGGVLTTLYSFCAQTNCTDGSDPYAGLVQATNGDFFGTTYSGGAGDGGTIFRITSAGVLRTLYSFCAQTNCTDGASPFAGLVQGTDGSFYGTTFDGGAANFGTVFSLSVGLGPFVETLPTFGKVGAKVIILGNALTGTTSVTFNGTAATFTVASSTEIKATVPTGATSGKVQVTTRHGTLTSNVVFQVK